MENIIIYSISYLVEAIILWQYASNLFVSKHSKSISILTLGILYFIMFSFSLLEFKALNMISYLLFNCIFLITQYQLKWHASLFHSAMIASLMAMSELTVFSITNRFTPHFFSPSQHFSSSILFVIFSKTLFFTIIYILIHLLKNKRKNQGIDKSSLLLILTPLSSVLSMITFINICELCTLSPTQNWLITLSSIFLLATNLLVFSINQYMQNKAKEFTEMQLLLQKESDSAEYYKMLLEQSENQSILIHDIKKHLQSIELLNTQGKQEQISVYLEQLIHSSDLRESARLCDDRILNAILCRYQRYCFDKQIAFHVDIRSRALSFVSDNDVTSLFCNLLDNAVEAAEGIPDGFLDVHVGKREKQRLMVITIINSCRKNPFSSNDKMLVSHKKDRIHHGFGLKSVRKIVDKYNGNMQLYYDEETATFHTIIALPIKDD